jgi:hypothetical protein
MNEANKSSLWFIRNSETNKLDGEIDTSKSYNIKLDSKTENNTPPRDYTVGLDSKDTSGFARVIY